MFKVFLYVVLLVVMQAYLMLACLSTPHRIETESSCQPSGAFSCGRIEGMINLMSLAKQVSLKLASTFGAGLVLGGIVGGGLALRSAKRYQVDDLVTYQVGELSRAVYEWLALNPESNAPLLTITSQGIQNTSNDGVRSMDSKLSSFKAYRNTVLTVMSPGNNRDFVVVGVNSFGYETRLQFGGITYNSAQRQLSSGRIVHDPSYQDITNGR